MPPKDLLIKGRAAAEIALQFDDSLAEAHAMRGIFKAALDFDWQGAEDEFRQALTLDPKSAISRDRGPRRRTRQYVEEPDGAQRSRHARIRRRSRKLVRSAG